MLELLVFLLVGRLTIYLLQKFPFQKVKLIGKYWKEGKLLAELFACDLCLGVWVFACLSFIFGIDFVKEIFGTYLVVFNQFMTGAIASFLVHLVRIGWTTKFGIVMLE